MIYLVLNCFTVPSPLPVLTQCVNDGIISNADAPLSFSVPERLCVPSQGESNYRIARPYRRVSKKNPTPAIHLAYCRCRIFLVSPVM